MADFCKQCSIKLFGEDHKDLAGFSKSHHTVKNMFCAALCEGCGPIQVDHEGACVSKDCSERGHRPSDDGVPG